MISEQKLVGRVWVDHDKAHCHDCKQPFEHGVNIFTPAGHAEVAISGTCEKCFDSYFKDEE